MKLSIIIPVFNEEKTIQEVIQSVSQLRLKKITQEILVIDDGSTDGSLEKIKHIKNSKAIKIFSHDRNLGKGAAVQSGIAHATGDYILIQDADLEYNPSFIPDLLAPVKKRLAQVVYGTRLKRFPHIRKEERSFRFFVHYIGNRLLSLMTSILYGQWLTDMETCYKLFPKEAVKGRIRARGFDFEPEITAKLLKRGYRILEVPIKTKPRGYDEGKKLHTIRDGCRALWTLLKYRFVN